MAKRCKSEALATVHEIAQDLTDAGAMTKPVMATFDEMCLAPDVEAAPEENSDTSCCGATIKMRAQRQSG